MASKRKNPPPPEVVRARQEWGQHLQDALTEAGMTRQTLGFLIGYKHVKAADQLVTGQNGPSMLVYTRILSVLPPMRLVPPPPIRKFKSRGAPGPHKPHDYPEGTVQRPPIRGRKGTWNGSAPGQNLLGLETKVAQPAAKPVQCVLFVLRQHVPGDLGAAHRVLQAHALSGVRHLASGLPALEADLQRVLADLRRLDVRDATVLDHRERVAVELDRRLGGRRRSCRARGARRSRASSRGRRGSA